MRGCTGRKSVCQYRFRECAGECYRKERETGERGNWIEISQDGFGMRVVDEMN